MQSESGITLLFKSFMDFSVDEDLVSGLLAALNQFTVVEFKQGLESIEMAGLRWVYLEDKESKLLFIAADTKDISTAMLRARLTVIKQSFLQTHVKDGKKWAQEWNGNVERYQEFKKTIEEYYTQWVQAETVTTIAEFFDILGIFQQIFNLLMNIVEAHVSPENQENIFQHLETMFINYKNRDYVKNDPELSKISFNRTSGFNIISINLNNCDMMVVEKHIITIMKVVVDIIKGVVSPRDCISFFIEENIFDYIISNFKVLNELNLAEFFLRLFLLI